MPFKAFMCCVVCVLIMMVVSVNIVTHDNICTFGHGNSGKIEVSKIEQKGHWSQGGTQLKQNNGKEYGPKENQSQKVK